MKTTRIIQLRRQMTLLGWLAAAFVGSSCSPEANAGTPPAAQHAVSSEGSLTDTDLSPKSVRLASIAFEAGSKLPTVPHAKNRARMQASVIDTCAKVGLLKSGLGWSERIEGWQQGIAMAHLASAAANGPQASAAHIPLERAKAIVADASPAFFPQEWQRDRVRAGIATTLIHMGRESDATAFERDLEPSEDGASLVTRCERCPLDAFDAHLVLIDQVIASQHFDRLRHAVDACAALLKRFATDSAKVELLEAKVHEVVSKFPSASRFDALARMAQCALDRQAVARARVLINEAIAAIPPTSLLVEERIPLLGRVAVLHHRSGDAELARDQLRAALDLHAAKRERIVDIARASAVRGVAEAAFAMGQHALAFELWEKALVEGVVNPNSRPRADDLIATCCSILRSGAIPTDAFLDLASQQLKGLNDPW